MFQRRRRKGAYRGPRTVVTPPPDDIDAPEDEEVFAQEAQEEPRAEGVIARAMERLDAAAVEQFGTAFDEARVQAKTDAQEVLDENDIPLEAREAIAKVEGELGDELATMLGVTAKVRVQIAEKGMRALEGTLYFVKNGVPELAKTGLELLDLNTSAKAYAALLEIVPTVALWYAVTGKKVKFKEDQGVLKEPYLEDIDRKDRLLYLAGSVFFLGHVYAGFRHTLLRKGFWTTLEKKGFISAAQAIVPAMQKLVGPTIARAQHYGIRKLTSARPTRKPTPPKDDQT